MKQEFAIYCIEQFLADFWHIHSFLKEFIHSSAIRNSKLTYIFFPIFQENKHSIVKVLLVYEKLSHIYILIFILFYFM